MRIPLLRAAPALLLAASLSGCSLLGHSPRGAAKPGEDADLLALADWMTGSFGSGEQAEADSSFFDIRLHMARIWPGREDGFWLYVEQAIAEQEHRPYRQRVCKLHRIAPATLASTVYMLPGEERFVGAWRSSAPFDALAPDSLEIREGCSIYLTRVDPLAFRGETRGRECASTLRGAAYATSEATVTAEALVTWDRGFDEEGNQVWGPTGGGYVFKRLPND
ncbi:MAG: chromophore lyase CpcT/CpeT [Candidatus Eisenbacteria bacterium]